MNTNIKAIKNDSNIKKRGTGALRGINRSNPTALKQKRVMEQGYRDRLRRTLAMREELARRNEIVMREERARAAEIMHEERIRAEMIQDDRMRNELAIREEIALRDRARMMDGPPPQGPPFRDGPPPQGPPFRDGPPRDGNPFRDIPQRETAPFRDGPQREPGQFRDGPQREPGQFRDGSQRETGPFRDGPQREPGPFMDGPPRESGPFRDGPPRERSSDQENSRLNSILRDEMMDMFAQLNTKIVKLQEADTERTQLEKERIELDRELIDLQKQRLAVDIMRLQMDFDLCGQNINGIAELKRKLTHFKAAGDSIPIPNSWDGQIKVPKYLTQLRESSSGIEPTFDRRGDAWREEPLPRTGIRERIPEEPRFAPWGDERRSPMGNPGMNRPRF